MLGLLGALVEPDWRQASVVYQPTMPAAAVRGITTVGVLELVELVEEARVQRAETELLAQLIPAEAVAAQVAVAVARAVPASS